MIQRTFGQVKAFLAEYALNNGVQVTDARLLAATNRAIRELMNEGEWPGIVDQWYLKFDTPQEGLLTCPSFIERILQVTVDDCPKEIRSPWFEFCQYGPGPAHNTEYDSYGNQIPKRVNWGGWMVDRGESCTRWEIPNDGTNYVIRVYATVEESTAGVNPEIMFYGLNQNGDEVRSGVIAGSTVAGYITGESVEIDYGTFTESQGYFSKITSLVKPVTNGPVRITAWNGVQEVELARFEWWETNPTYRRYYVPDIYQETSGQRDRIIRARCRRKFREILQDNDPLMLSNEVAVVEMIIAQYKRQVNALDEYLAHKQTAIDLLRKEAIAHMGNTKNPAVTFTKGFHIMADVSAIA